MKPSYKKRGRPSKISLPDLVRELEARAKVLEFFGDGESSTASQRYYGKAIGLRSVAVYLKTGKWIDDLGWISLLEEGMNPYHHE